MDKFAWQKALRGAGDLTHAEFRVLVILSTFTDATLGNAFPGLDQLTELSCVSRKTAKAALKSLAEKGWIELTDPGGNQHWRGKANVYRMTVPKGGTEDPPTEGQGGSSVPARGVTISPRGVIDDQEGGSSVDPHQVLNQPLISMHESGAHSAGFFGSLGLGFAPDSPSAVVQVIDAEPEPVKPAPEDPPPIDLFTRCWHALGPFTEDEEQKIKKLIEEGKTFYKIRPAIDADRAKLRKRTA